MKNSISRLMVLSIVAVIALSTLGVGYAMWSETLHVGGTVTTGTFDVKLYLNNQSVVELVSGVLESSTPEAKDVADCSAQLGPGLNSLDIQVTDAFPSYTCAVTFRVYSNGTIPAHVHQPVPVAGNPAWVTLANCYQQDVQLHNDGGYVPCTIVIHFDNDDVPQSEVSQSIPFSFDVKAHQFNEEF